MSETVATSALPATANAATYRTIPMRRRHGRCVRKTERRLRSTAGALRPEKTGVDSSSKDTGGASLRVGYDNLSEVSPVTRDPTTPIRRRLRSDRWSWQWSPLDDWSRDRKSTRLNS